jgi:uncharacterized Zn finger protein (UPF0148 family)
MSDVVEPSCPICGVQPVFKDDTGKFMLCKSCGHKENLSDFMEEAKAKLFNEVKDSFTKSLEGVAKRSKNLKFTKK